MGLSHVSLHYNVGFSRKAAVEAMEMKSGHSQLTVRISLTAGVRGREHFKVLELDALWKNILRFNGTLRGIVIHIQLVTYWKFFYCCYNRSWYDRWELVTLREFKRCKYGLRSNLKKDPLV